MNIAYIYLEKYKHLENVGFNFLPNHKFEYKKGILTHRMGEPSHNLYGNVNITAIIGENGTGKSTLLEFICNYNVNTPSDRKLFIIVTKQEEMDKNNEAISRFAVHVKKESINYNKAYELVNFNIDINSLGLFSCNEGFKEKGFESLNDIIYYSNILDFSTNVRESNKLINISSNHIINVYNSNYGIVGKTKSALNEIDKKLLSGEKNKLDEVDIKNLKMINEYVNLHDGEAKIISYYKRQEAKKILNFFVALRDGYSVSPNDDINKMIYGFIKELNIPTAIIIRFSYFTSDLYDIKGYDKEFYEHINKLLEWNKEFSKETKKKYVMLKFLMSLVNISLNNNDDKILFELYKQATSKVMSLNEFNMNDLNKLKTLENYKESRIYSCIEYLNNIINSAVTSIDGEYSEEIIINIGEDSQESKKVISDFFWLQSHVENIIEESHLVYKKENYSIMEYEFNRNLSSGELSFLTLISRIHSLRYKTMNKEKDFFILLDEPEMYFHLEWQRKFFSLFSTYLNIYFNKAKSIHLIITSHSPFLISDIPRENVIFLKKDKDNGKTVVDDPEGLENTFAANIHTLAKNGFFMTSTIGEFAKSKIEEVIKIINDNKYQENKEYCDYVISIIGEPLIRDRLNKMIADLEETPEDEILRLEQRIKELKRIKND